MAKKGGSRAKSRKAGKSAARSCLASKKVAAPAAARRPAGSAAATHVVVPRKKGTAKPTAAKGQRRPPRMEGSALEERNARERAVGDAARAAALDEVATTMVFAPQSFQLPVAQKKVDAETARWAFDVDVTDKVERTQRQKQTKAVQSGNRREGDNVYAALEDEASDEDGMDGDGDDAPAPPAPVAPPAMVFAPPTF
ncbi:hypothetical protein M885DRAFT_538088 [Pelagophyceae sp. CCMP2097]|nr:hypothetical protein M885DRAFT_538088 [Pelagophyceae sp. CCMP2097]